VGSGALIAYLKSLEKKALSKWIESLMYGFVFIVLSALFITSINVRNIIIKQQESVTTIENIEGKVRSWLDDYQYKTQKINNNNDLYFQYHVTVSNAVTMDIQRMKSTNHFLTISAVYTFKEIQEHLDKLPKDLMARLLIQMRIETARLGLDIKMPQTPIIEYYVIECNLPINEKLTEADLIKAIQTVEAGVLIVQNSLFVGAQ